MNDLEITEPRRPSDELYRLLVEAITDYAIYMLDPNGIISNWNAGAQRFKGYRAEEVVGSHFSRFYSEKDRANGLPTRALEIAATQGKFASEGWRVRKDGTQFWAHVVIDPIRGAGGEILGYAKITRDLTERRAAEQSLRNSQEQFRLLVQSVTDYAIYMIDSEGHVSSWNAGAERIKGYTPDEIIGSHFSRFYTAEDVESGLPDNALETARSTGRFEAEGTRIRKDGTEFRASVVIDAIWNDAGELIGFAKITRDVTERDAAQRALERAREALFQSQKMDAIGQLTGGIAHDFNNLLMAILSSLELLGKRLPADPMMQKLVNNAVQGAERGATLTQRMLAFARRQELTTISVDIPKTVMGMADLLQRSLGPAWSIETRFPLNIDAVSADINQLEMALLNLVVNARDAMPDGGTITIQAREHPVRDRESPHLKAGKYVNLSVTDTGIGMDAATLARAMEPFFTTKGVGKGTGLGLSMIHGFADQLKGTFLLKSKLGEGTTAEIWLPTAAEGVLGLADQMIAEELRLLGGRTAAAKAAAATSLQFTWLMTALSIAMLALSALFGMLALRREIARTEIDRLMQSVLKSIKGAVFAKDRQGRYTLMSEAGIDLFDRPVSAIIGRTDAEIQPPLFAAIVADHDRQVIAHGGPMTFDEAIDVSGRTLALSTIRTPVGVPEEDCCGIAGVAIDVTSQRETEARLVRSEVDERAIFDLMTLGIAQADPLSRHLIRVNARLCEITGYSANELGTMTIDALTAPEDLSATEAEFTQLIAGDDPLFVDKKLRRKDGSTLQARINVSLARGPDGAPLRAIVMIKDVTERRQNEIELKTTGTLLHTILEASPGLIYAKDTEGRMILANAATLALTGKTWPEVEGKTDAEFLSIPEEGRAIVLSDRKMMEDGVPIVVEEPVTWPDGTAGYWLSTKSPMRDDKGAVIGMVGISLDITARKLAEAELRHINKTLSVRIADAVAAREVALAQLHEAQKLETIGQLTGGVAHDFNNLLTPIMGGLELLQRRLPNADDKIQRLLSGALQAAERARVLVARLLTFSRRQKLEPRAVALEALLDGMQDLIAQSVGPAIRVSVTAAPGIPPVLVDPAQFELTLLNLAVNSRDAMPDGGTLRFEADEVAEGSQGDSLPCGRYVRLSVIDDGIGMDEPTLRRAVEPFFSTKVQGKGTGLGLSMAHGLAAQSGGSLQITSSMGKGTRVDILLPATEFAIDPEQRSLSGEEPDECRTLKILLVDDEELVRRATASMLIDLGHDVTQAASGVEALGLIKAGYSCDLLVTDYLMPGMNGAELADKARKAHPMLPVLVITGFANLAEGARKDLAWLAKPFRQADLAKSTASVTQANEPVETGGYIAETRR
jgi:PAS domain S-box-containing protein